MSARSTHLLVDNSVQIEQDHESLLSRISFFVYNYLINPVVFNRSNKVSLIKYPQSVTDVDHKPLDWYRVTEFISTLKKSTEIGNDGVVDLMSVVTDILQSLSFGAKKLKSCDILVVSAFDSKYDWDVYESKMKHVIESNDNINLIIIDTMVNPSENGNHFKNLEIINNSIISANMNNVQNFVYTLQDAIASHTKVSYLTPKFRKPVEIYSYKLQILGLSDLEFNVSAYPFVKRSSMADYMTSTKIDAKHHEKLKYKYVSYYEEYSNDKNKPDEKETKEINNPSFIIEGYKFGTSSFLVTDLPNDVFNLNSLKSMTITSFVPVSSIAPWYLNPDSLVIFPSSKDVKNNKEAGRLDKDLAMYSELWYSMVRLKVAGTVRYVKKNGADVKYGLLYPQGFVDSYAESTGAVDFGCFIFVQTIFKDDEKLVNLPDLFKMKMKDPKMEAEIDDLVDSFCIDKGEPRIEARTVSMNNTPINDVFYNLREDILETDEIDEEEEEEEYDDANAGGDVEEKTSEQKTGNTENEPNIKKNDILTNTLTHAIRKYNNPLMSIERLIYLLSYFVATKHLEKGGDDSVSLYDMYEEQGIPDGIIKKWLDTAEQGVFRPTDLNEMYK